MSGVRWGVALPAVETLLRHGVFAQLPDRELLERFVSDRDRSGELAFTALVARHGPMVLGVCRRILRDAHDADDAFQATFLVLARRAGSIRLVDSLGPWLQGVSRRVALRLKDEVARPRARLGDVQWVESIRDQRAAGDLDTLQMLAVAEVLEALPDPFRPAIRLCYLEGLTHEEAAARLGCPVGTVRSRLSRGRALLRKRLKSAENDQGPGLNGAAHPTVTVLLLRSTTRAAVLVALGQSIAAVVPIRIANLVTGVLSAMSRTTSAATLLIATATLAGWAAWAGQPVQQVVVGQGEIEQPPSDRLRGDFDGAVARQLAVPPVEPEDSKKSDLPADFPASVVQTEPKLGDADVDPETTKEIRVTFSKPMTDKTWSWVIGNVYASPESNGEVHYLADKKTCVMPVKLEPGKTYVVGINGGRFHNFKDAEGHSSLAMTLAFRTRAAK
jgi:RNA polymerase sigma-70 factor (ECF subfamily)